MIAMLSVAPAGSVRRRRFYRDALQQAFDQYRATDSIDESSRHRVDLEIRGL